MLSPLEQECQRRYQAVMKAAAKGGVASRQAEQATSIWVALQHELVDRNAEQIKLRSLAHKARGTELEGILDQLVEITAAKERSLAKHLFLLQGLGTEPLSAESLTSPLPAEAPLPRLEMRFQPEDLKNTRME